MEKPSATLARKIESVVLIVLGLHFATLLGFLMAKG